MSKWGRLGILMCLMMVTHLWASIGKVSLLKGEASATRENQTITLANGTTLEQHDVITTKANSQIQLTFEDKTVITLGSESILDVKEYLNDAQDPKAKFKFSQGTFKSITGQIGKKAPENFNLETRTATIGIRGTTVVGQIGQGETPDLIGCSSGRIVVSNPSGSVVLAAGFQTTVSKTQSPTPAIALSPILLMSSQPSPSTTLVSNTVVAAASSPDSPQALTVEQVSSTQTASVAQAEETSNKVTITNNDSTQQAKLTKVDKYLDTLISQPATSFYTYNGSVTGSVSNGDSLYKIDTKTNNAVKLDFDFGGGSGALKESSYIKFQTKEERPQVWQINPSGAIDGKNFTITNNNSVAINGRIDETSTSTVDGTFQNAQAKKINGTFSATSGINTATGTYKATR